MKIQLKEIIILRVISVLPLLVILYATCVLGTAWTQMQIICNDDLLMMMMKAGMERQRQDTKLM